MSSWGTNQDRVGVGDPYVTGDPMDNTRYWDVTCAALPPLSATRSAPWPGPLDRIQQRRHRAA